MTKVREDVWVAKGEELFGTDRSEWRFRCPACGTEHCARELRERLTDEERARLREGDFRIEAECLGRHLPMPDCDWAAYGLFRGPVIVIADGREVPVFDFAGQPFTAPAKGAEASA